MGVAVFRRSNAALIVFDRPLTINTTLLRDDPLFSTATVQVLQTATVIRVPLDAGTVLSTSRTTDAWHFTATQREPALRPIQATVADDRLVLPAAALGSVVSLADPDTGATILVGTQRRDGQGVPAQRRSPEFTLLPTWLGVAVMPNADTMALRPTPQGFVIAGAHTLTPPSDIADQLAHSAGLTRRFDFSSQPMAVLQQRLQDQMVENATTPSLARGPTRQAAARTMIAFGLGAEAEAVLRMAAADDPHEAGAPDNPALASIADLLAHRPDEASGLADPRLAAADDLTLWRAVRLAQSEEGSAPAAAMLAATLPLLLAYPAEIRDRLLPLVAETLVAGGEAPPPVRCSMPARLMASSTWRVPCCRRREGTPLRRCQATNDWRNHPTSWCMPGRPHAPWNCGWLRAQSRQASCRRAGASAGFLARRSARACAARTSGRAQGANRRVACSTGPAARKRNAVRRRQGRNPRRTDQHVAALLRNDTADSLAPLELVSLVAENADLLPTGPDGELLQAKLADRLVALDLPKRAGPVLEKLAEVTKSGVARAAFAARLAALRLREGDAAGALGALDGLSLPISPPSLRNGAPS